MGHIFPSLAVCESLRKADPTCHMIFVTSKNQIEYDHVTKEGFECVQIAAPKFPRREITRFIAFPFLFPIAILQAIFLLARSKPNVLFLKGGFVSVPVGIAGFLMRIPFVIHESDAVPGLATRCLARGAARLCVGFEVLCSLYPAANVTGNPVRSMIMHGRKEEGMMLTKFSGRRPVVMLIGGSQGAERLNQALIAILPALLDIADVIHLTGPHKSSADIHHARYFPLPFASKELPHLYALSDVVVTRAGAGTLSELSALKKAVIAIPLPGVAHDHQQENANILAKNDSIIALPQDRLIDLFSQIAVLCRDDKRRKDLGERLARSLPADASERIAAILLDVARMKV